MGWLVQPGLTRLPRGGSVVVLSEHGVCDRIMSPLMCRLVHMSDRECGRCGAIRKIRARGLCGSCYNRIGLYGDDPPAKRNRSVEEAYAAIDRSADGCWPWPGTKHSHGYGVVRLDDGTRTQAHRWVWEREVGPIPDGQTIDHVDCETKSCVRVDHLEVTTRAENLRRAVGNRADQKRRLPPCAHGEDDVYVDPSGKRVCRICRRLRTKLWREERRSGLGHY